MNQEIVAAEGDDLRTVTQRLAACFDPKEVKFKPQVIQGNRAMAMAYIDARTVQDRLDEVLGVEGWQDSYEVLPDGSVVCRLKVLIDGQWLQKMDVGSPSEQPDGGDRMKAAFCVPLDAMALTPDGWASYDRIRPGDLILGYDMPSGICRWTPANAVNVFTRPCDMLSMNSKSFNATCTPEHRWVISRRGGGVGLKETARLDSRDRIVVAAPAESGSHQLTDREAAILGWLATDGGVHVDNSRRQFHAFIHQSKVANRDSIRLLLGDDAVEHISPADLRRFPGHDTPSSTLERSAFRIKSPIAKSILSRAGLYAGGPIDWRRLVGLVTRLSISARGRLFESMMLGDGQHSISGQIKFGKKRKPGVMEAFEVLATLQGIALGTLHGTSQDGKVPLRTLRVNPHTWNKCIELSPAISEASWCPTTALGTWVMMWSGQVSITGNSDSLKRAAVKFGIGRYLYRLPANWCDFDPVKRVFVRTPALPAFALPRHHRGQPQAARAIASPAKASPPEDGRELLARIKNYEVKLVAEGLCGSGDLLAVLARAGARAGLGSDIASWGDPGVRLAARETKAFEARARCTAEATPAPPAGGPKSAVLPGDSEAGSKKGTLEERLKTLHRLVKAGGTSKTWGKALNWFSKEHKEWGIRIPEQFEEPATEGAAAEMAEWITEAAVDGMLEAYATAARVGKAAAEVRRNT